MVFFAARSFANSAVNSSSSLLACDRGEGINGDDRALDVVPGRAELLGRDGGAVELLNRNLKKRFSVFAETGGDGVSTV